MKKFRPTTSGKVNPKKNKPRSKEKTELTLYSRKQKERYGNIKSTFVKLIEQEKIKI